MIAAGQTFTPEKIQHFIKCVVRRPLYLTGLLVAVVLSISLHTDHTSKRAVARAHRAATVSGEERKIYPLSVIHGGAYSADELNRARRLDSVVRAHYADFGNNPVMRQAPADLFMYISYRKSDKVYWTRTKLRIPKGESVLSDGKHLARARCGNRLSFTPQQPLSPETELSEGAFNAPEVPKVSIPFDVPAPPATEADLYVPASSIPADLFSPLLPPFTVSRSLAAAGPSGRDVTMGISGGMPAAGSPFWGGPFFYAYAGGGFPAQSGVIGLGTPAAIPAIIGIPEPAATKLLLLSILILILFPFRARMYPRL
jgi:hypothetical protein